MLLSCKTGAVTVSIRVSALTLVSRRPLSLATINLHISPLPHIRLHIKLLSPHSLHAPQMCCAFKLYYSSIGLGYLGCLLDIVPFCTYTSIVIVGHLLWDIHALSLGIGFVSSFHSHFSPRGRRSFRRPRFVGRFAVAMRTRCILTG